MAKNKQRARKARKARIDREARRARRAPTTRGSSVTAPGQPMQIIFGDTDDCSCPICLQQALSGEPRYTMDASGNLVELPPLAVPETFTVTVRGQGEIVEYVPAAGREVTVAFGCSVCELLESLCFAQPAIWDSFEALHASIDGEPCDLDQVVRAGEVIEVGGVRDIDPFASFHAPRGAAC